MSGLQVRTADAAPATAASSKPADAGPRKKGSGKPKSASSLPDASTGRGPSEDASLPQGGARPSSEAQIPADIPAASVKGDTSGPGAAEAAGPIVVEVSGATSPAAASSATDAPAPRGPVDAASPDGTTASASGSASAPASAAKTVFGGETYAGPPDVPTAAPADSRRSPADQPLSSFCRRTKARAETHAAKLEWPSLAADLMRAPYVVADPSLAIPIAQSEAIMQLRVAANFSVTDFLKARKVREVAEAECDVHAAEEALRAIAIMTPDIWTLQALEARKAYLEAHKAEWDGRLALATTGLHSRAWTLDEHEMIASRVDTLERDLADTSGRVQQLKSRLVSMPAGDWDSMRSVAFERAVRAEQRRSDLELMDGWNVGLSAGALVPFSSTGPTAIGGVHVTYNLGHTAMKAAESRFREARTEELDQAPYEAPSSLARYGAISRATLEALETQLATAEVRRQRVEGTLHLLKSRGAAMVPRVIMALELEIMAVEADRVYLQTQITTMKNKLSNQP